MEVRKIPIGKIRVNKGQPRKSFDSAKLENLAESIQEVGQLQPVIVKKDGTGYILVAGERRLRAIKKNKEKEVAAVILDDNLDSSSICQIQLIENIQRQDLNPLERAVAIQQLIDENNLTKKDASKKLGIPRTTLTEWLNILDVKEMYRQEVIDCDSPLSLSHISLAKGLASRTGDPTRLDELLNVVLKYHLSRNETKQIVDIIYKYLNISTEEAVCSILLKREHKKIIDKNRELSKKNRESPTRVLVNTFTNMSSRLEKLMDKIEKIDNDEKRDLMGEFLYIYQMMEIMIPELKDGQLNKLINSLRQ
ncbi:MAG: ParB/RepB/Spo0J family partition protein [Bacillota bacterium]